MQAGHPTTGSLPREPPLLRDLQVRILSSSVLHPSAPTEKRRLFLSNIDQVLNFSVETIHFFPPRAGHSAEAVAETLRSAVERVLVPYDFLAGRLIVNQEGRLEIECNSAGVGFVVAASGLELVDIGELEYPNPAFLQLATAGVPVEGINMEDQPLCSFQVPYFFRGNDNVTSVREKMVALCFHAEEQPSSCHLLIKLRSRSFYLAGYEHFVGL